MTQIFVDTSALLAIMSSADPWHAAATRTWPEIIEEELLTTNYVVVETIQLTRRRLGATAAASLIANQLPVLSVVWVDEETHGEALRAYRPSGGPSLVDEVSFTVMRRLGVQTAFAYDADFDRLGFLQAAARPGKPTRWLRESCTPYIAAADRDLVGIREIAVRSGRSVNTIQSWRRRHADFPSPTANLAGGPIWRWEDINAWIAHR